jgi:hypothetical protein
MVIRVVLLELVMEGYMNVVAHCTMTIRPGGDENTG